MYQNCSEIKMYFPWIYVHEVDQSVININDNARIIATKETYNTVTRFTINSYLFDIHVRFVFRCCNL